MGVLRLRGPVYFCCLSSRYMPQLRGDFLLLIEGQKTEPVSGTRLLGCTYCEEPRFIFVNYSGVLLFTTDEFLTEVK